MLRYRYSVLVTAAAPIALSLLIGCPSATVVVDDGATDVDATPGPFVDDAAPDGSVNAGTVSFDFEVTVTHSWSDAVSVGQTGSGRIEFEPNQDTSGRGGVGPGFFSSPPAVFSIELGEITLVAGSKSSVMRPDLMVEVRDDEIVLVNRGPMDALIYWGHNIAQEIDGFNVDMALALDDTTGTLLIDRSIPRAAPVLSSFDRSHFQIRHEVAPGVWQSLATLSVDSITPSE